MQRLIVALIALTVLGLAYASGALAADMSVPPPPSSCADMGKAPPEFLQVGKAPPDCMQMDMGKAPPEFLEVGKGKAPPPMEAKSPLIVTKAPPAPPPPPAWTGYYVGGDIGAAWFSDSAAWNPLPDPATFGVVPFSTHDRVVGFGGGGHVGYDDQIMPEWVVGFEGDWTWTNAKASSAEPWNILPGFAAPSGSQTAMSANLSWLAAARGRVGYLVSPTLMAYATGGAAWAKIDYGASAVSPGAYSASFSGSSTQTGFVAGGGVEWLMMDNWSVRAEYLYYGFNNGPNVTVQPSSLGALPSNFSWGKANVSVAQAGVSYKF